MGCVETKDRQTRVEDVRSHLSHEQSPKEKDDVARLRRRLTVGEVEEKKRGSARLSGRLSAKKFETWPLPGSTGPGLLAELESKTLLEALSGAQTDSGRESGGKKWSIGSLTDRDLGKRESFSNKTVRHKGDQVDTNMEGIGYSCKKGLKPESPNQDSWFILKVEHEFSMYAVMDGHGKKGHDVSDFVKEYLPKILLGDARFKTDPAGVLVDAFREVQNMIDIATKMQRIDASDSGSTASVVVHSHAENKIWVAHCGDSRCCIAKRNPAGSPETLSAVDLTRDHKPDLADEKKRIESCGGQVLYDGYSNYRVFVPGKRYPGLNMSRALGDLQGFEAGISAEPEVKEVQLSSDDELLILATDGVWEFISGREACGLIGDFSSDMAMTAAEMIAREAWDAWIEEEKNTVVDDITALVIYLNKVQPPTEPPPEMGDDMFSVMPGVPQPDWSTFHLCKTRST